MTTVSRVAGSAVLVLAIALLVGQGPAVVTGGIGILAVNPGVQKEVEFSDAQAEKAEAAFRAWRERHRDEIKALRERGDPAKAEYRDRVAANQAEIDREIRALLSARQAARLDQIALQERGVAALLDPAIQDALKLSPDQKKAVAEIERSFREDFGAMPKGAGRAQFVTKAAAMRRAALAKALALLTPEQSAAWREMVGPPFEVQFAPAGRRPGG